MASNREFEFLLRLRADTSQAVTALRNLANVGGSTGGGGLRAFQQNTKNITGQIGNIAQAANSVRTPLSNMQRSLASISGVMKGFVGFIAVDKIYEFSQAILGVGQAFDRAETKLLFTLKTTENVNAVMADLKEQANRLGLSYLDMASQFGSFIAAAQATNLTLGQQRNIFLGVSEAASALQLSAESTRGAFFAIQQMLSKGKVSSEEFRLQLAERMPIALAAATKATGKTTAEFTRMLQNGELISEEFLPKFADALRDLSKDSLAFASTQLPAQVQRAKNAFMEAADVMYEEMKPGLTSVLASFADFSPQLTAFARDVGVVIGNVASLIGEYLLPTIVGTFQVAGEWVHKGIEFFVAFGSIVGNVVARIIENLKMGGQAIVAFFKRDFNNAAFSYDFGFKGVFDEAERDFTASMENFDNFFKGDNKALGDKDLLNKIMGEKFGIGGGSGAGGLSKKAQSELKRAISQAGSVLKSAIGKQFEDLPKSEQIRKNTEVEVDKILKSIAILRANYASLNKDQKLALENVSGAIIAIQNKAAREFADAKIDEYIEKMKKSSSYFDKVKGAIAELRKKAEEDGDGFSDAFKNAFDQATDAMAEFIVTGKLSFGNFLQDIAKQIAKAGINKLLVEGLFGAFDFGGIGGFLKTAFSVGKHHNGGRVGSPTASSMTVNPAIFAGAPRFHTGLRPDEFPAILQRGETVTPRNQMPKASGGGLNMPITINIDGPAAASAGANPKQLESMSKAISAAVKDQVAQVIYQQTRPGGSLYRGRT